METGEKAKAMWNGEELYQVRAREALPLLVRQAFARRTVFYKEIAEEMGMPNARNMNYVLGSVGTSLIQLGKTWCKPIPPIQCLVINRAEGLPGEGISWFLNEAEAASFGSMTREQKRRRVQIELERIYDYTGWAEVLQALGLKPTIVDWSAKLKAAAALGAGESEEHRGLKEFVARNPQLIEATGDGVIERALPSGDKLDVSFESPGAWVAAEVKSRVSGEADIVRGLFQCVKYHAVMRAEDSTTPRERRIRAVLVLEESFPAALVALRNTLGVEVVDRVQYRPDPVS